MTDAIKFGKKAFTWSVVAMTVLWSMGVSALVPLTAHGVEDCNYSAGDLLQIEGDQTRAVYLLNDDLERMYFPNGDVYRSWYADFSGLNVVSAECAGSFSAASAPSGINYRPGSKLVRFGEFPQLYYVGPGNMIHWITSEAVAVALFGTTWNQNVAFVLPVFESNYTRGADLTEATLQDGMLVRVAGSDDVWYVWGGERSMVEGTLPSYLAGSVRTVSAEVAESVSDSGATVTPATVVEDPAQGAGSGSPATPGTPVAAGTLSVALAADTPASGYAMKNSTRVPFTKVVLTAGNSAVTVKSLKIERTGSPASDGAFTGVNVVLPDGSLLASNYKSLNSSHQATFTEDVVVPANSSVALTLVGKMANSNSYGGEVPMLALAELETDASVSGSLPIQGNARTINTTVTVGSLTVAESPALGTSNEEVGTEDVEFVHVRLTNGSSNADIDIQRLRFYNAGTAGEDDLGNLELLVDGAVVATAEMDGRYANFDLSSCGVCTIEDGKNETFLFRGDLVAGSGRTVEMNFKIADDIVAYDELNNTYIVPSGTIDYDNTISVGAGKLTVSKTNDVLVANVAEDANGVKLGSWNFKVEGEPITVKQLVIDLSVSGTGNSADLTNLRLVDADGNSVTGNVDGNVSGSATSTDSFTLPIGDNMLTLVGDLNTDFATNDTIQVGIDFRTASHLDATGDVTGDAIEIDNDAEATPNSLIQANLQTVKALSLNVTTLAQPAANTVAAGSDAVLFGKVRFDAADAGEDIKVTGFTFELQADNGAKANEIQNITFKVGDKTLGITKNGSSATASADENISVTLSTADQFTVPKGSSVVMEISGNISAGATASGDFQLFINSTNGSVTAQGATSGNSVTATLAATESNNITVGTAGGALDISLAASNPSARIVAAGTEATLAAWNFYTSTTEDVELDYIYVSQVNLSGASSSYTDYDAIWFEDEAGNEIAGTRMTPTSSVGFHKINFANDAFIVNRADTDGEILYLKAKLASIGNAVNGTSGNQVGFYIGSVNDVVAKGALTGSGTTEIFAGTAPNSANAKTHYMFKAYPRISYGSPSSQLANTTMTLFNFTVTAVNGPIDLYKFSFNVATSSATITDGTVYLYETTGGSDTQLNTTGASVPVGLYEAVGTAWTTPYPSSYIPVAVGAPKSFALRGDVTGASSGSSISTYMHGDNAVVNNIGNRNVGNVTQVDAATHDDFIWSDRGATGAQATTAFNWTNGFLVDGLPGTNSSSQGVSWGS